MRPQPDLIHESVPGAFNQTFLLLHGIDGSKRDLIPLRGELGLSSVPVWIVGLLWLIPDPESSGKLRSAKCEHANASCCNSISVLCTLISAPIEFGIASRSC